MEIRISICPTDLDQGGDILDADRLLAAIRAHIESVYPDAWIRTLQVGYRQSDAWFQIDGEDSNELAGHVYGMDWSDESLYAVMEVA